MQNVDLQQDVNAHVPTLKAVPQCIRSQWLRILTQVLLEAEAASAHWDAHPDDRNQCNEAWKLFVLLPRLLLHHTSHGGDAGQRELTQRVVWFDTGQWDKLYASAEKSRAKTGRRPRQQESSDHKLRAASDLAQKGELSHAARLLSSPGLAPGTPATLDELKDPTLRPPLPAEPYPDDFLQFHAQHRVRLNHHIFADVLRRCRRGQSAGVWGGRYEYYKVRMENDIAFEALCALAHARIPTEVRDALHTSTLTALKKPNNKVRGIAAGDTFRRLVAKTLAR